MANKTLNVALIGQGFMGRTHSNAWAQVNRFFDLPLCPVQHTLVGRRPEATAQFARTWGWQRASTDWKSVVASPEIDLVDVTTPNNMHAAISMAVLAAGKHCACEKPLAASLRDAREMAAAARKAKGKTFVWYSYRRVPAVGLAYQLARAGKLGEIRHVRAHYLQDWAGPDIPLAWRFDKKVAGSGAHGDLNAHIIDMARFVTGLEITNICGAISETFVKERRQMTGAIAGGLAAGLKGAGKKVKVAVDDAMLFLARFSNGAVGSFESTRQATGNQNRNGFEINGTKGAVRFDFERMNELEYYDATADRAVQGWTNIMVSHGGAHPYAANWWPDAHVIGYEHTFTNQAYDMMLALAGKKPVLPLPDFEDAYQTQRVLEAAMIAAVEKRWVKLAEVK